MMRDEIKFFILYILKYNFFFKWELKKLEKLHSLSKNEIDILKFKKIKKLLKKSLKSKFYRDLYKTHNIDINGIQTIEEFDKLPIVTREMIQGREEELLTKTPLLLFKGSTSGTTGSALTVYYDYRSVVIKNAYIWMYRNSCGLKLRDPIVSLRGELSKNEISKYDRYTNTLHLSTFNINSKNIYKYHRLIKEFKPKAISAYPSSLSSLVNILKEHNLRLNVELSLTSSETILPEQIKTIEEFLNTKVLDWYGNAERTIALQNSSGHYQELLLYSHCNYLKDSIITTNLNNLSSLLIRYRVDDSVEIEDNKIVSILGRSDDFIILKDDSKVVGTIGGIIFKGVNGVKCGQIVQNRKNNIDVNLVISNFTSADRELLIENIYKILGDSIEFAIRYIKEDEIIYTSSGKFKVVINNLL